MLYSGVVRPPARCQFHRRLRSVTTTPSVSASAALETATPAMRQYLDVKRQHRDAIVFFRMGDFYEMFYEDALVGRRACSS